MAPMLPMGAPILGQFSESPKSPKWLSKQDATNLKKIRSLKKRPSKLVYSSIGLPAPYGSSLWEPHGSTFHGNIERLPVWIPIKNFIKIRSIFSMLYPVYCMSAQASFWSVTSIQGHFISP